METNNFRTYSETAKELTIMVILKVNKSILDSSEVLLILVLFHELLRYF